MEVQGEQGWVLQGSSEISTGDFADIRRVFALYIDALREMADLLTTIDRQESA
jgi:hypothetical protein